MQTQKEKKKKNNQPELGVRAVGVSAVHLVLSVFAIAIEIAHPIPRYALLAIARERVRLTLDLVAVVLIGVIAAIIIAVAFPEVRDTDTAVAGELIGGTAVSDTRTRRVVERLDTTRTHAFAVLHDHAIGTQTYEAIIRRAEADVRALRIVSALVRARLYAVCVYLDKDRFVFYYECIQFKGKK